MNNAQVAHVWAQNENKSARGSNFYCEGATIYSYGSHFPIARHDDSGVILFTNGSYSNSTAKHINHTRYACHRLPLFRVDDVMANSKADHRRNHDALKAGIESARIKLARKRTALEFWFNELCEQIERANAYASHFKLGRKALPVPADLADARADAKEAIAREKAKKAREKRAREAKEKRVLADLATDCEAWKAGEKRGVPYAYGVRVPCMLRFKDAETVQTSWHAEFPAEHAQKAWRFIQAVKAKGENWARNGQTVRVGHFQINRIAGKSGKVWAGCHIIEYAEMQRFADLAGWN